MTPTRLKQGGLHKIFKTSTLWLVVADLTRITVLFITLSRLVILRYRPVDWILVALGGLLPLVIVVI